MLPPKYPNDVDRPPEQEMAAIFAASTPSARAVDVAKLLPMVAGRTHRASQATLFTWRNPMFRRIAALASATAGVVAVVVLFMLFGSSSRISFAEVMDQVAKTRSVMFKSTTTFSGGTTEAIRTAIRSDGLSRIDMPNGDYTILDTKSNSALQVSPAKKTARVFLGLTLPSEIDLYEMIRNVPNDASVHLPNEVIDGRKVNVFQVEWAEKLRKQGVRPPWPIKLWVDPQTKLPIRMEPMLSHSKQQTVMSDFVFDPPLDASLFSLQPPEGYTVTTDGLAELPAPPEKLDLLAPRVIPGVGLGPVKFGMSRDEVIKIVGKPDVEKKVAIEYPSRGYGFSFSNTGTLAWIYCFSQQDYENKTRDFAGKTKEGIGIGSSLQDLRKAFSEPESVKADDPKRSSVHYSKLGLHFVVIGGKVVGFSLLAPRK